MRILFLCKRQPQGRDLLLRPFGRFFHLPARLAERGHTVHVAALSHRRLPSLEREFAGVRWSADDLLQDGPLAYLRRVANLAAHEKPDWIVGCSDTYYGILAVRTARRCGARAAVDAYDNFESYLPGAWPLHLQWRRALRAADQVTAAGPQLAEHLREQGARRVEILPMAADPSFVPMNARECRRAIGLDPDVKYVGCAGSLDPKRGGPLLAQAARLLVRRRPEVQVLVSGRHAPDAAPALRYVGMLADDAVPRFVNSLDVAFVPVLPNAFGRFSYPAKLYEAIACGRPVAAADTEPTRWILQNRAEHMFRANDPAALVACLEANLDRGAAAYPPQRDWTALGADYERMLG